MKIIALCLFAIISGSLSVQALDRNPLIRVRLQTDVHELSLSGVGLRVQGERPEFLSVAISRGRELRISRVQIQGKNMWRVQLAGDKVKLIGETLLSIQGAEVRSANKSLPAKIFLSKSAKGFDVIGVMPLEDYLVGVLASEMPLSWPTESLKAQAIAARSYSLATIEERKKKLFHVESTILDQVFRHVSQGIDHDPLIERAFEAVNATRGQVLVTPENEVYKAFYHADCGGATSSAKSVWGYGDRMPGAVDAGCPSNPKARWTLELSQRTLTQKLTRLFAMESSSVLVAALEPLHQGQKTRADQIRVRFNDGTERVILADTFRAAVGYGEMRSTQFDVQTRIINDEILFSLKGRGFGHGVGLCQWGSRWLALQKKSHREILTHYYPLAVVR